MRKRNGIVLGCFVSFVSLGCSLQKLDPINEGNTGKGGSPDENGGAAGNDTSGGMSNKGGTLAKGGASIEDGPSQTGGTTATGGTSSSIGGTTATGGTSSSIGGTTATGGPPSSVGGTTAVHTKPWLAYVSSNVPYLLDITKSAVSSINLATLFGQTCSVQSLEFSPDGKKLLVGCASTALYVIDVSGPSPGTPMKVNGNYAVVDNVGWSPDSRWIAFFDNTAATVRTTTNVYVVDTNGTVAPNPVILAQNVSIDPASHGGGWAGANYFVWSVAGYYSSASHYNGSGWLSAVTGPQYGGFGFRFGKNATGKIVGEENMGTIVSFVYDFATNQRSYNLIPECSYSPDLTLAICQTAPSSAQHLFKPFVSSSTTYGTFDAATTAHWANLTNIAAITPTTLSNARLVDGTVTAPPNTDIPRSIGYTNFVFAANDSWLALQSTTRIAALPLTGTVGSPTVVSTDVPTGGTLSTNIGFAPNNQSMYYIGQQTTAGVSELYWVNLSGAAPVAPRKLNATLATGVNVTAAGFSADSTSAYYVAGTNLYLTELGSTAKTGVPLLNGIAWFRFQR